MDGLLYLLNKAGLMLAQADQENAQLRQQLEALSRLSEYVAGGPPESSP